jgi:SAM-dependent methyltransferase
VTAPDALDVHPANREQWRAWDGTEGAYWAAHADEFDRSVARYTGPFLDAAAIAPGERVLDIGCGTGRTTRAAAGRAPGGAAVGIDLSAVMLDVARREADQAGLTSVRFVHGDAQVHPFDPGSFDVAISRSGAMFFADPVQAFRNIAHALVPRGRLVLLVWQSASANEWFCEIVGALAAGRQLPGPPPNAPGPFGLADRDRIRTVLSDAGYQDVEIRPIAEPMWFGRDADDAVSFILGLVGWMLEGLDEDGRDRAVRDLRRAAEAHLTDAGVEFESATWLVTARRQG